MSISKDSRNILTQEVTPVSAVTGLQTAPAYLELRDRIARDPQGDQEITVLDHVTSPANLSTLTLHDPRFYWAIMDISDVVDPFELAVGDRLLVPSVDRLLFELGDTLHHGPHALLSTQAVPRS